MTTLYFAQIFAFFSLELLGILHLKIIYTLYFAQIFAFFSLNFLGYYIWKSYILSILLKFLHFLALKLTATYYSYWVNHDYPLFCPIVLPFFALKLTATCNSSLVNHNFAQLFCLFLALKLTATWNSYWVNHDYTQFCPIFYLFWKKFERNP